MTAQLLAAVVKIIFVPFKGGFDILTPPLSLPDGYLREAQNFECSTTSGYQTVLGYERFDGRTKPSSVTYAILNITLTGSIAVGNTITGVTSAATAVVLAVVTGYLVITKIVGTFNASETLNVSGAPQATTTALAITDGASTTLLHAQYINLAADNYRADIAAITGSGNILGVIMYNDVVYAFRNNAGATAAVLWKSTSSGWSQVTLYYELSFTVGSGTAPAEAATITKGAVSATVKRVILQSGTWAGGTAAGRFIISAPAGGSFPAGAFTAGVTATCSGAETQITLQPSGRYEFDVYNFYGGTGTNRIYGCDRVNRGFEFDGDVFVPIVTGMTSDVPIHVRCHKNHLFLAFSGSVQHSSIGFPYQWSPVSGAAELAMGDTVTGFMPQAGTETTGALAVFSRNRISILYGTGGANWNLVTYLQDAGAFAHTIQQVGHTLMLDDRGITTLEASTSYAYGNFITSTLTQNIQTWINERRTKALSSCIVRDKSQYRIFFSDKSAAYITLDGTKVVGIMPIVLEHQAKCVWSGEMLNGSEAIFFGSDNGMVYQMEKGTSLDGSDIEAYAHLGFNFIKSPRMRKRFRKAVFEVQGTGYAEFQFSYDLGYTSTEIPQSGITTLTTSFSGSKWDSFTWDAFIWDGQTLSPAETDMTGTAENVSIKIRSVSDYYSQLKFSGVVLNYSPRRLLR